MITVNSKTSKHLYDDPSKVNEIRLEHFQNFKKLRRRMDHAYLKLRHLQSTGRGGLGDVSSRSNQQSSSAIATNRSNE